MYLTKLHVSDRLKKQFGLKIPDLELRSNIIGIVGKNGAGKTRFLNCINNHIIADGYSTLNSGGFSSLPETLQNASPQNFGPLARQMIVRISSQEIKDLKNNNNRQNDLKLGNLINSDSEQINADELKSLNTNGLAYFTSLCTELYLEKVNYMGKEESSFKKTKLYQNYKSLREKFNALIGKELDYRFEPVNAQIDDNGVASGIKADWTLNGRKFNYDELSDGEKTLFWYILLLFLKENYHYSKTKNSIILLDEPELHLHPEAQYKLFYGLSDLIGDTGQLFIATHSLSFLSCLNYDQIYLTDSNEIFPPNSLRPFESISKLLGDSSRLEQIKNFISNVSLWAYDQFMFNNFKTPEVISTSDADDPQFKLFVRALKKDSLKLLDFGCGQGRLLNLIDSAPAIAKKFSRIDAFEPNKEYQINLNNIGCVDNVYHDLEEIDNNYDIILLSNVLHEIQLDEIVPSLNKLNRSLSEDGFISIIEDLILRKGEKPNDNGFIVFNSNELSRLLKTGDNYIEIQHPDEKYRERIMCFIASKENLKQTNSIALADALSELKKRCKEKLHNYRSIDSYSDGRSYGFYAQQYINAEFALEESTKIQKK